MNDIAKQPVSFDAAVFVMGYESGDITENQFIDGFQQLIDSGLVWKLQGRYGRTAADLIRAGKCTDTHDMVTILPPTSLDGTVLRNTRGDRNIHCECENSGYFNSGIPGIIAHVENGRLAGDAKVERCDLCQRYNSDEAALAELQRRGIS